MRKNLLEPCLRFGLVPVFLLVLFCLCTHMGFISKKVAFDCCFCSVFMNEGMNVCNHVIVILSFDACVVNLYKYVFYSYSPTWARCPRRLADPGSWSMSVTIGRWCCTRLLTPATKNCLFKVDFFFNNREAFQ